MNKMEQAGLGQKKEGEEGKDERAMGNERTIMYGKAIYGTVQVL